MNNDSRRPLSPHLQIYKPQITSVASILHRLTGVLLSVFSLLWVAWLLALNHSPAAHAALGRFFGTLAGKLLLIAVGWMLLYHLLNGIRHLIWDTGHLLELQPAKRAGWIVVVLSLALTAVAAGAWL